MSQESQKFPSRSISSVFCESDQHSLHWSGLGKETQTPSACRESRPRTSRSPTLNRRFGVGGRRFCGEQLRRGMAISKRVTSR